MSTKTEVPRLEIKRSFAAPRERVFSAWCEPEQIRQWFGPEGCHVSNLSIDLKVGGKYRLVISSPEGDFAVAGVYREITPPSKIVYTWQWENDPDYVERETLVTVDFADLGGSTEISLTHENLPSVESAGRHEHGWTGTFEKLSNLLRNP